MATDLSTVTEFKWKAEKSLGGNCIVNKMRSKNLLFSNTFSIERKIVHDGEENSSRHINNKFTLNLNIEAVHLMLRKIRLSVKFGKKKSWYYLIIKLN